MPVADEIGYHLTANTTGQTFGTSLFVNALPDETAGVSTVIVETASFGPQQTMGGATLPQWEHARVQVITRSTQPLGGSGIANPTAARTRAQKTWECLTKIVNQTVGATSVGSRYYLRVEPLQSPFLLDRDNRGRTLFAANYECWRKVST